MNCLCSINTHGFHKPKAVVVVASIPSILNYNFSSPIVANNTNLGCGVIATGTSGAFTATPDIPSWSFTAGNNVASVSIFVSMGVSLANAALNYPVTGSQYCVIDITGSSATGTTWVMIYQNLIFPAGTRTVTWYMQNGGNTNVNAYFTASIGGISGATQNYTTTTGWTQCSFTFTVTTAGTYPLQFTNQVVNNTGNYVVASIGNIVLT